MDFSISVRAVPSLAEVKSDAKPSSTDHFKLVTQQFDSDEVAESEESLHFKSDGKPSSTDHVKKLVTQESDSDEGIVEMNGIISYHHDVLLPEVMDGVLVSTYGSITLKNAQIDPLDTASDPASLYRHWKQIDRVTVHDLQGRLVLVVKVG